MESLSPDRGDRHNRPGGNGDGQTSDPIQGSERHVARPMDPNDSPGWFGYIAVGIALVSMGVGLIAAVWLISWVVRRVVWPG